MMTEIGRIADRLKQGTITAYGTIKRAQANLAASQVNLAGFVLRGINEAGQAKKRLKRRF